MTGMFDALSPPTLAEGLPRQVASQAQPVAAGAAVPERIGCLLRLIRWIIGHGNGLAATLHERAVHPDFDFFASRYRVSDLKTIVARIRRGLLIAHALLAKLEARAAQGRDIQPTPLRNPAGRRSGAPATPRQPPRTNLVDLPLDRMPTAEEIAEELRRRPLGAVVVDICRDLCVAWSDMPDWVSRDLRFAILHFGGNLCTLMFKERQNARRDAYAAGVPFDPWDVPPVSPELAAELCRELQREVATGPPDAQPIAA